MLFMVLVSLWTREQRNQLSYPEVAGGFFHKVDLAKKKKKFKAVDPVLILFCWQQK